MLPLGYLSLCGAWILLADFRSGEWEEEAVVFAALFIITLWRWNRVNQEVEVWIHENVVRMRGHAGTVELDLQEVKRVRIIEERRGEHALDRMTLPWWARRWGRIHDRIEVEFEDMTVLGKRVIFRLERRFSSARRDRDPRFVRWMQAVNRRSSGATTHERIK
jgi:hypothetical protein